MTKKKSNTKKTQQRQRELRTRHDKGIDERPDLVGESIKRQRKTQLPKMTTHHIKTNSGHFSCLFAPL